MLLISTLAVLMFSHKTFAQDEGELSVSMSPSFAWFSSERPYGNFRISNTGTRLAEISVSVSYGVIESPPDGASAGIVFGEEHAPMLDLTEHLSIFPPRMIIPPGETQTVRYAISSTDNLPPGGYVSMVSYKLNQRAPVVREQVPASSAGVQIEYTLVAPLVFIKGQGQPVIRPEILSLQDSTLSILLHNDGTLPWTGRVTVGSVDREETYGDAVTTVFTRRRTDIQVKGEISDTLRVMFLRNEESSIPESVHNRLQQPKDVIIVR